MRIEELKQKEVINTCNCKILGCADDIEFDKWCGLVCSDFEYVIPFKCIVQVGPDIILVKVDEKEVRNKIKV